MEWIWSGYSLSLIRYTAVKSLTLIVLTLCMLLVIACTYMYSLYWGLQLTLLVYFSRQWYMVTVGVTLNCLLRRPNRVNCAYSLCAGLKKAWLTCRCHHLSNETITVQGHTTIIGFWFCRFFLFFFLVCLFICFCVCFLYYQWLYPGFIIQRRGNL